MSSKEHVISLALELDEADRLEILEKLYESLEGPSDIGAAQAWSEEIARRLSQMESGSATFVPWEQARRQIRGSGTDERAAS